MSLDNIPFRDFAEDGLPGKLKCIICEKEIPEVLKARPVYGRTTTYIGECCKDKYPAPN